MVLVHTVHMPLPFEQIVGQVPVTAVGVAIGKLVGDAAGTGAVPGPPSKRCTV